MKKIITRFSLIICLGFCLNFQSQGNPIIEPPMIIEIYFSSGDVFIELLIPEDYGIDNLNGIRMIALYDTAEFRPGITFTPGQVFYVTEYDFETPIYINPAGDGLTLEVFFAGEWRGFDSYGLHFGEIPYSGVTAPKGEESIAYQRFSDYGEESCWAVKELPNTIGSNPFNVSKRAEFSGFVKDKDDEPLANVELYYCADWYHYASPSVPWVITDENGYFHTNNMFCKRYHFRFLHEGGEIGDTTIFIEPDSANYFVFKLDTLLNGIKEHYPSSSGFTIRNSPNPASNQVNFVVESKNPGTNQKGVIKIYSVAGYIMDIIPLEISGEKQQLVYDFTDKSLAAGLYFYSLEIGRTKMASGKMMISR